MTTHQRFPPQVPAHRVGACPARSAPRPRRSRSTWRRSAPRSAQTAARLQGDRLHVPLRRQRLVEHGAAHRHDLVRPTTPGCAPRRPTRSRCWRPAPRRTAARRGALAGAPGRRAADHAQVHRRSATENNAFTFALHPCMTEVQTCSAPAGSAILANAGPLVVPLTQAAVHRRTRSRGRRRSARTTTSSRPGRPSAPKA